MSQAIRFALIQSGLGDVTGMRCGLAAEGDLSGESRRLLKVKVYTVLCTHRRVSVNQPFTYNKSLSSAANTIFQRVFCLTLDSITLILALIDMI